MLSNQVGVSLFPDVWLWWDWGWADIGQVWVQHWEKEAWGWGQSGRLLLSGSAGPGSCLATAWLWAHNLPRCSAHTLVTPAQSKWCLLYITLYRQNAFIWVRFYHFLTATLSFLPPGRSMVSPLDHSVFVRHLISWLIIMRLLVSLLMVFDPLLS